MSFLDNLRDRITGRSDDDYYDDDEFYDEDFDDEEDEPGYARTGLLGNSRRPEPESVAVYTRSGHHVGEAAGAYGDTYDDGDDYGHAPQPVAGYAPRESYAASPAEPQVLPRSASTHLPPYVLRPASYDDAQMVVRRVRTNQPVVLVLHNTNLDAAKRILDFCYGFSLGAGGAVQELGDRVFVVLPAGAELSRSDIDKLVADGDLAR